MRGLLVVAAAALSLGTQIGTASSTPVSFAFGRVGGSIAPFTVTITSDGSVRSLGPVRLGKSDLNTRELTRLSAIMTVEHFFMLPRSIRCPNTLPDFASEFVVVRKGGTSWRVLVHGDCSARFTRTYAALAKAVGVRAALQG